MKYFMHLSDSLKDPFISDLIDEFRGNGYMLYFRILEMMASDFEVTKDNFNQKTPGILHVSYNYLTKNTGLRKDRVKKILWFFQKKQKMTITAVGDKGKEIEINCPKFTSLYDKNTKDYLKKLEKSSADDPPTTRRPSAPPRDSKTKTNTNTKTKKKNIKKKEDTRKQLISASAERAIKYLFEKLDKNPTKNMLEDKNARARVKDLMDEGMDYEAAEREMRAVVDKKVAEWGDDIDHRKYLRCSTLYGREKFHEYRMQDVVIKKNKPKLWPDDNFDEWEKAQDAKKAKENR